MLSSAKVLVELLSLGSGNSELFQILPEGGWFKNPYGHHSVLIRCPYIYIYVYTYIYTYIYIYTPHVLIIYMVGFLVEKTCVHINVGGMYA